jgi:alpha-beta hydrolase superfamily lysophospholipase
VIIYTANYGGKDRIRTPRRTRLWNKDLKFVYFTDEPFESKVWDVVVEKRTGDSNRVAKWYKLHPHELFPGESTLWVDASIVVRKDPTKLFQGWEDMLLRNHHQRTNIYGEADTCVMAGRDAEAVKKQIAEYKRLGCPKDTGLYQNSTLLRKPSELAAEINRAWWAEIEKYSTRDQISLPYVLWANGFSVKSVDPKFFTGVFSRRGNHNYPGSKDLV